MSHLHDSLAAGDCLQCEYESAQTCDYCGKRSDDLFIVEDTRDWDGDGPHPDALVCRDCQN